MLARLLREGEVDQRLAEQRRTVQQSEGGDPQRTDRVRRTARSVGQLAVAKPRLREVLRGGEILPLHRRGKRQERDGDER
jgi:hypothetical protein